MYDVSRYKALIKNEQRKVRATTGLCCNYRGSRGTNNNGADENDENIELLNQILEDNGNCCTEANQYRNSCGCTSGGNDTISFAEQAQIAEAVQIEAREQRRNRFRNRRRCNNNEPGRNNDNTLVYRFANQNFLDNSLGKTNIDISNPGNNTAEIKAQIQNIMKRYGKRHR